MSEIKYLADKVFVHRWPHDTPLWDSFTKDNLDVHINKNPEKKQIIVKDNTITIENIEFFSLKKIGISVPFFKDECTVIFEGRFGDFFGHAHITIKSGNYLDIFNQLIKWRESLQNNY
jgi:hypothetical protein